MMNTSPFRSHLMQSFAANARTQSRPPIALFSFGGANSSSDKQTGTGYRPQRYDASTSNRHPTSSSIKSYQLQELRPFSATSSSLEEGDSSVSAAVSATTIPSDSTPPPLTVSTQQFQLQQLIASRRTVSNFVSQPSSQKLSDRHFLHDAIARGVEVAITAPNRKVTEPTTFHRILTPSVASERLLTIAYKVTLRRLLDNKLSGDEACRSEAIRKREKWAKIPAFVVATVSGMEDQASSDDVCEEDSYRELPHVPPATIRQLEDYASASASIQNLLLSLHAEGLGSKWATGPVIRTRAFRDLIGCDQKDMVVGLIMVGWPKSLPRLRRRRAVEGDVLRDVNYAP
mmetsp:Transcript_4133/g.10493  ORF Transcript_4133/g.10493 Transcript_4133/m.10493 type:complete len:344 (+) Transcript_4133:44-1075(+)